MKSSAFTQNDNARLTPKELNGRDWEGGRSSDGEVKRNGEAKKNLCECVCVGIITFHSNAWPSPIKSHCKFGVRRICALEKQWLVNLDR